MSPDAQAAAGGESQPKAEDKKSRSPRSTQNQLAANEVTQAAELLKKVLSMPEVLALIAKRGYDEAELAVGQNLHARALEGFEKRHSSLGAAQEAKARRDAAEAAARAEFEDYRATVRARFEDTATRKALGADGKVPPDLQKFVTAATAAYQAALKSSHAAWLAKRSFTAERLNGGLAQLAGLIELQANFSTGKGKASGATDERDTSVSELNTWMREFRTNVSLALRNKPDLGQALGL